MLGFPLPMMHLHLRIDGREAVELLAGLELVEMVADGVSHIRQEPVAMECLLVGSYLQVPKQAEYSATGSGSLLPPFHLHIVAAVAGSLP